MSSAEARPKKPAEPKKDCFVRGWGTLDHGDELLWEDEEGGGYTVYACYNGTVCEEHYNSKGEETFHDCYYDPAKMRLGGAGGISAIDIGPATVG